MTAFIMSLAAGFALLGSVAAGLSRFLPGYHLPEGLAGLGLMAVNAAAAVAILNATNRHPVRTTMVSMAVRLLLLGGIMLTGMRILKPTQSEAFSFVFTAMAGYLAFQALEIRHVIRLQARLGR